MTKEQLIIFTRNPELGKCKTRLAKTIGDVNALEVYKMLLQHTNSVAKQVRGDKAVYYSVQIRQEDSWDSRIYSKHKQDGDTLGRRMQNAFKTSFDHGYDKAVIIGSDLYDLKPNHIEEAYDLLDKNDVVIGPASDGGYYLLGLKFVIPDLFENKLWGTNSVFNDTLNDLENKRVGLLEELNDIDVYDDIRHYDIFKPYTR